MENNEGIDIVNIGKTILNKKYIIGAIILVCLVIGFIYSFLCVTPIYITTTKILIDKTDASITEFLPNSGIMNEAANNLNIDYSEISDNLTASFDKTTKTITIEVKYKDSAKAYNIVNKYRELLKTELEGTYSITKYDSIVELHENTTPINVDHIKDLGTALTVGIVISIIYMFIIINMIKVVGINQVEELGIMYLGNLEKDINPDNKLFITENISQVNKLKRIMANIELNKNIYRPQTLLFSGIEDKVGTTYTIINLASIFAEVEKKVLVIDCNDNNLKKVFEEANNKKVTISTLKELNINDKNLITKNTEKIINDLKEKYDLILIDGKSMLKETSSTILSNIVDGTVFVSNSAKTNRRDISQAKKYIENVNGKILGLIINNKPSNVINNKIIFGK